LLHQFNGSQCVGVGHVWPCQLNSLDSKHGLAKLFPTACQGFPKGASDDDFKVQIHTALPGLGVGHSAAMGT